MDRSDSIKPMGKDILNKTKKITLIGLLVERVVNLATLPKNVKTSHLMQINWITENKIKS